LHAQDYERKQQSIGSPPPPSPRPLRPLTEVGFTVIAFDGPGQGGALRQGIFFTPPWEQPAKAVLDHFKLEQVDWLGASWGAPGGGF
jgi:pimeloyl-ACP methyl ester carboxylesterase